MYWFYNDVWFFKTFFVSLYTFCNRKKMFKFSTWIVVSGRDFQCLHNELHMRLWDLTPIIYSRATALVFFFVAYFRLKVDVRILCFYNGLWLIFLHMYQSSCFWVNNVKMEVCNKHQLLTKWLMFFVVIYKGNNLFPDFNEIF